MSQTVLLTLGRLPKGLDIARSLAGAGCRVLVAEPARRHLTGSSRYVARSFQVPAPATHPNDYRDRLLLIIEREQVDLVIPVSEECLHVAALAADLPTNVAMFGPDFQTLHALHDKLTFINNLNCLGVRAPATVKLDDSRAAALLERHDCVIKARYSCAGSGLRYVRAGAPLPALKTPSEWLLQRQIDGQLLSTFSIVWQGRVIGSVVYEAAMLSGAVAVAFRRIEHHSVEAWIENIAEHNAYSGFLSFDLIIDSNNAIWPIECNPRTTSGLHFVRPDSLAQAILDPASTFELKYRRRRQLQQFFPALLETQSSLFGSGRFRSNLRALLRSRDVSWQLTDPLPFLLMPYSAWGILSQVLFGDKSFGEAATADIDWRPSVSE